MYDELLKTISENDTIIIHRHSNPDGDAIGSQVGLKHIIMNTFPSKRVFVVGDDAGRYSFMDDCIMEEVPDAEYAGALAIVLDSGAEHLISDDRYKIAKCTARVDHHLFVSKFCDVEVIDTSFESCCGIIADFARTCGLQIDETGAGALFTGMVTDSGRFRYDCTTAKTFGLASWLVEMGNINFNELYAKMYAEDFASLKRKSEFILKIRFTEKNVAYIYTDINESDRLGEEGMSTFSISRGMVGVMGDIKGVNRWVNFTEERDPATGSVHVLCELRSNKLNINPIAVKYGGGGHEKASGATVPDKATAMLMLKDLDDME